MQKRARPRWAEGHVQRLPDSPGISLRVLNRVGMKAQSSGALSWPRFHRTESLVNAL